MENKYSCYTYKKNDNNDNNYYKTNFVNETTIINTHTKKDGVITNDKTLIITNPGGKPYTKPKLFEIKIEPSIGPLGKKVKNNFTKCKTKKYCTMCKK